MRAPSPWWGGHKRCDQPYQFNLVLHHRGAARTTGLDDKRSLYRSRILRGELVASVGVRPCHT
jgi:hypothetical protein